MHITVFDYIYSHLSSSDQRSFRQVCKSWKFIGEVANRFIQLSVFIDKNYEIVGHYSNINNNYLWIHLKNADALLIGEAHVSATHRINFAEIASLWFPEEHQLLTEGCQKIGENQLTYVKEQNGEPPQSWDIDHKDLFSLHLPKIKVCFSVTQKLLNFLENSSCVNLPEIEQLILHFYLKKVIEFEHYQLIDEYVENNQINDLVKFLFKKLYNFQNTTFFWFLKAIDERKTKRHAQLFDLITKHFTAKKKVLLMGGSAHTEDKDVLKKLKREKINFFSFTPKDDSEVFNEFKSFEHRNHVVECYKNAKEEELSHQNFYYYLTYIQTAVEKIAFKLGLSID